MTLLAVPPQTYTCICCSICPSLVSVHRCVWPPIMSIMTLGEIQTNPPRRSVCLSVSLPLSPLSHAVTPVQANINGGRRRQAAITFATSSHALNNFKHALAVVG